MSLSGIDETSMERLTRAQAVIGYTFADPRLLLQALTHGSWRAEHSDGIRDYQRLEFLGDAVLNVAIVRVLHAADPGAAEGALTRARAALVSEQGIAPVARALGVGDWVRLGEGEERSGARERSSLLADVFEAVVGALSIDAGLEAACAFVVRAFGSAIGEALAGSDRADWKTTLQEALQGAFGERPSYSILGAHGPAHALNYHARVAFRGRELGRGMGRSKQAAQQEAARAAMFALTAGGGVAKTLAGSAAVDTDAAPDGDRK